MRHSTLAALMIVALLLTGTAGDKGGDAGIPDKEIGLSKVSVFDVAVPDKVQRNHSEPGDLAAVPAGFPEQPPVIPHGVGDFNPITFAENECMDCHAVAEKEEGEPTPIPHSHYIDFRNAPEAVQEEVVGARYNCASCHVSPGDNKPLVSNTFGK